MKAPILLASLMLVLSGCADETAKEATIQNASATPVVINVTFSTPGGEVMHMETLHLAPGGVATVPLDRRGDGNHHLDLDTGDDRSRLLDLHWQGNTGPLRVRVIITDHEIEDRVTVA